MFPKIVRLGSLSAIVVYNDATESCDLIPASCWLLLHASGVPQSLEGQSFQLVPANAANGGACIVSTYFGFLSHNKDVMLFCLHAS